MTGDADGGVNGLGGDRADVGLVSENPSNSFFLPASNTSAVLMLDSMSNVGSGGVWLFRVDQDFVIQPSMSSKNYRDSYSFSLIVLRTRMNMQPIFACVQTGSVLEPILQVHVLYQANFCWALRNSSYHVLWTCAHMWYSQGCR